MKKYSACLSMHVVDLSNLLNQFSFPIYPSFHSIHTIKFLVCDYRRRMDWILDLLTTCIHRSELYFTDH
jgi:hypothetical protein